MRATKRCFGRPFVFNDSRRVKLQQNYDGVKTAETLTDAYGRTLQESSLQPGSVWKHLRSTYGSNGLLTKQEELAGSTVMTKVEYTYDNYRRITQEKQTSANNTALNKTVNYTYSGLTETRTTVTDQEETVTLVYDAKGNLLSQADSKGTTTYSYDAAGRLTGVASPGYPMTATYNAYGLCTSVTNPSSGTTTYTYNGFDELATETDAKGNTITYTYNASGLPTSKNDGTRSISYAYNNKGELVYNGYGGNHQIVYTYTDGLLTKEVKTIEGVSFTKQYTYDSKGRLDTYTSPSGLVQKYGYDSAHHLTGITDNATGAKLWEAKTYNAQGLIATENGVDGRQTTYTYDQTGRPLTMSNNLASFTYTYNGGGQLTKRVENFGTSGLTETFAYDAGGCLTSSTLQDKTPVTVSYNSGRGISNKSDVGTYSYGANGAPLATVSPVSGYNPSTQSITYNSSNLPASITQGGYTRTYTYDVDDQRDYSVLTKSNSTLPFAASKHYYFGDFERNINTENNVVTDLDYIFADGRLVALIKTVGSTKTSYGAMTDRQGSLRALYNGSGLVQSFSYDAWGNRRNPSTGAALTTSELVAANSITARGYTCHEHMDEFGLINMNARIYDPALGMFISVDPLAQEYYNTYPYAYCGGDPVNAVDPTGEMKVIYNPDGTYKETTHNNWFHNTFMDREIYIDYGDRMVRVSEEEFWQWQETGQWGSIKEADKLTQFEFWLDKPSDNIVDNVIKFFASEAYSFFNSPMVTFTGRTLGGTYQTPSERMENFIGIIEMLPITKSLRLTHPGTSKQFYKNHGVNYFSRKKYKQEVNKYKINNKNKDAFNWIYNYYITPFNETKEE